MSTGDVYGSAGVYRALQGLCRGSIWPLVRTPCSFVPALRDWPPTSVSAILKEQSRPARGHESRQLITQVSVGPLSHSGDGSCFTSYSLGVPPLQTIPSGKGKLRPGCFSRWEAEQTSLFLPRQGLSGSGASCLRRGLLRLRRLAASCLAVPICSAAGREAPSWE